MKKAVLNVLIIGIMVFLLIGCSKSAGKQSNDTNEINEIKERTIVVNIAPAYTNATLQILKDTGMLEEYLPEGVNVEWTDLATGPDIRDALVSGKVDFGGIAALAYIVGHENGQPLTLVSYEGSTPIKLYSNSERISKVEDISEEDLIAITNKSTTLHGAFLAYCKENLGDALMYDNNLSAIPAADALSSLASSSDYQAAIFSFPMYIKAEELDNLTMIADMTDVINEYGIGAVIVANEERYNNDKDIIEAFKEAHEAAIEYICNNSEEAADILSDVYGVEKEALIEVIQECPPTSDIQGYDKQAELLYEAGLLDKEPTKFKDLENYEDIVSK